jgi:uncharacterized protein YbjT (DUF2867 family)
MRVFVAGATGAIGRPLIPRLLEAGHEVTALARTPEKARVLGEQGVEIALADAFDEAGVHEAVVGARPEVLIHQLTALPSRTRASTPRRPSPRVGCASRPRRTSCPPRARPARAA